MNLGTYWMLSNVRIPPSPLCHKPFQFASPVSIVDLTLAMTFGSVTVIFRYGLSTFPWYLYMFIRITSSTEWIDGV